MWGVWLCTCTQTHKHEYSPFAHTHWHVIFTSQATAKTGGRGCEDFGAARVYKSFWGQWRWSFIRRETELKQVQRGGLDGGCILCVLLRQQRGGRCENRRWTASISACFHVFSLQLLTSSVPFLPPLKLNAHHSIICRATARSSASLIGV